MILDDPRPRTFLGLFQIGKSYTEEVSLTDVFGKYDPITGEYGIKERLNKLLGKSIILYSLITLSSNIIYNIPVA